jgi:excisionase family DNA binding protein
MEERMVGQDDRLLTAVEAAEFLGLRLATIRKLTYQRRLPVVRPTGRRTVRYRLSHLEKLVKERTQPAFFNAAWEWSTN